MRGPRLPGYGTRTEPVDEERRSCRTCRSEFAVDLNAARVPSICPDCESAGREDAEDARLDR